MGVTILVVLLLVLVNTLYVAAEFSAVSVRRSRIQQRMEEGNDLATRLFPYISDSYALDRYIATCQIGITVASLVLGAFAQARIAPVLIPFFQSWGRMQVASAQSASAILVLVGLTCLQMILGELVPKSLALQYPTPVALYTVVPMQWSIRVLSWFIGLLNGSGVLVLRLLRMSPASHRHIHSPGEIEYLIAESKEGGMLEAEEHARLRKALRLGVTTVNEVMIPRVRIRAIAAGTPFNEVMRITAESAYTRHPVYEGTLDNIVGYIHVQDVARRALGGADALPLRRALFIPTGLSLERVLNRLRAERQHMALVADEYGGIAGLVTVSDVLDDILGGVADEFKPAENVPERLEDGRFRVPGSLRVEDAEALLGVEWDVISATVGGLVMETLGRLPEQGERLEIDGIQAEVTEMDGHSIAWVVLGAREGEA
jgi:CBS domain containing-hemolysin-like protein